MLTNYLKITWRNIRNNPFISFVNIFGLAIGLTCCMLISVYLNRELSYDLHHRNTDRLYLLGTQFAGPSVSSRAGGSPAPLGKAMQNEFPEISSATRLLRLFNDDKTLLQYAGKDGKLNSFYETKGYLADSNFFSFFDYPFTEGNPAQALMEPNSIVLSATIARKMFGNEPALNKVIHVNSSTNGSGDYRITGVFQDNKHVSHIDSRFFISLSSGRMGMFVRQTTNFASNNMFNTYLLLHPGADAKALEKKFPAFVEKYMRADLRAAGFDKTQFLVAVKDIHLRSNIEYAPSQGGNLTYLYILASIALFILIIACINFMNLATARSARRAAEVGVRKVLGAQKKALVFQFLAESMVFALLAAIVAFGLTRLLLPFFSYVSASELSLSWQDHSLLIAGFIGLALITGLLAGSYPAFYLAAFKPIRVLKGRFSNSLSAITFRKALVVFQFMISAALIIAVLVIGKQMRFMQSKDLGFAREQQIVVPLRSDNAKELFTALRNEVRSHPQVAGTGGCLYYPGIFNASDINFYTPGKSMAEAVNIEMNWVDHSFLQTLEIKPLAGRLFSEQLVADTSYRMILNETAIRKLGFQKPADAIGRHLLFDWNDSTYRFEVIGVVQDFHFESLHRPIMPYGFQVINSGYNYLVVHTRGGDPQKVLQQVEAGWNKLNPTEPFEYSFLDEDFAKNYQAESRLASMVKYFMLIAITISCLGLFGLAAFSAEQRTKEIGIRKILGSSVTGIAGLLSKDFLKLVLIGNIIALPVAWYMMHQWLQDFAFRTNLSWWLFAMAVLLSLAIALITVSYQAIKAALMNPVKSLRSE